jgi:hypothetical protein
VAGGGRWRGRFQELNSGTHFKPNRGRHFGEDDRRGAALRTISNLLVSEIDGIQCDPKSGIQLIWNINHNVFPSLMKRSKHRKRVLKRHNFTGNQKVDYVQQTTTLVNISAQHES